MNGCQNLQVLFFSRGDSQTLSPTLFPFYFFLFLSSIFQDKKRCSRKRSSLKEVRLYCKYQFQNSELGFYKLHARLLPSREYHHHLQKLYLRIRNALRIPNGGTECYHRFRKKLPRGN